MEKAELAYIVYVKTWEATPKVRADIEKRLKLMCDLNFNESQVADANED